MTPYPEATPQEIKRQAALRTKCPECGAPPGKPCTYAHIKNRVGEKMELMHFARYQRVYEGRDR